LFPSPGANLFACCLQTTGKTVALLGLLGIGMDLGLSQERAWRLCDSQSLVAFGGEDQRYGAVEFASSEFLAAEGKE
jgi:hypothetical protein